MLSKIYESTEVDRRYWLQVPSGTGPLRGIKYRRLLRCIQHFKSNLINDMCHIPASPYLVLYHSPKLKLSQSLQEQVK